MQKKKKIPLENNPSLSSQSSLFWKDIFNRSCIKSHVGHFLFLSIWISSFLRSWNHHTWAKKINISPSVITLDFQTSISFTCQRFTTNSKGETKSEASDAHISGRGGVEGGPGHVWILISGPPTLLYQRHKNSKGSRKVCTFSLNFRDLKLRTSLQGFWLPLQHRSQNPDSDAPQRSILSTVL